MTLRSYLWGLRLSTYFIFAAWLGVVFFTDPVEYGAFAFVLFYVTFFLFVSGMSALALTHVWRRMAEDVVSPGELGVSLRQGILIGVLVTLIIALQQSGLLVWWTAILVTAAVLLIELHFLTKRSV